MSSVPDPLPPRKPRRWGLYGPFLLLLVAVVAWSGYWFWLRIQTADRLEAIAAQLKSAGYEVSWKDETIGGYPFRQNVTLIEPVIREPSGWALSAPRLESESYLHGLGTVVVAAPQGLTFTRPQGGPVQVAGKVLHASVSAFDKTPPNVSFEGAGLTFTPGPGAQPFGLMSADKAEIHLRAGPDDQAATFFRLDGGTPRPEALLGRLAGGKAVSLTWDATLSKVSAFKGADWRAAVRAWTDAGGQAAVKEAGITAGPAVLGARSGRLTVGSDGRLRGQLDVTLHGAIPALATLAAAGAVAPESAAAAATVAQARQGAGDTVAATLSFEAGQTTLGPVAVAPAPIVY
jgi:hypothetical protein